MARFTGLSAARMDRKAEGAGLVSVYGFRPFPRNREWMKMEFQTQDSRDHGTGRLVWCGPPLMPRADSVRSISGVGQLNMRSRSAANFC